MPVAYCEESDVQDALQEADASMGTGPLSTASVEAAIHGASKWFKEASGGHYYDSTKADADLISNSPASAKNRQLSVASSPHRQNGQIFKPAEGAFTQSTYPITHVGQYTRVKLPKRYVESIDTLEVREFGGDVTDWVADAGITEGRGEDYYTHTEGGVGGRSHLYLHAGVLGPHKDFEDVLNVDLTYGLDYQDSAWDDIKRGVAAMAAAQLVVDDDVLSAIPDDGSLIGVDTQAEQLMNQAMGFGNENVGGYLSPYLGRAIA